jgi:hypothetical protein
MTLLDAIVESGSPPAADAAQATKKRYSEVLSAKMAVAVSEGLRGAGFPRVNPVPGGPHEKAFQGGLGPKKVDVSYADEQHGLLLAVSIKSINSPLFGKNLKNRFGDLCTEAVTPHMRFPYSVVCGMFLFPAAADEDITPARPVSTFRRATKLFATISGREDHMDPAERFENFTMVLFQPVAPGAPGPWLKLFDVVTEQQVAEPDYFLTLREIYNRRNPHAAIGEGAPEGAEQQ